MDVKSFGELMDDLGFKKEASFETKKAFLKYLFQEAAISELAEKVANKKEENLPKQLSLFEQEECA